MSEPPSLAFVAIARQLEIEAVEGGRPLNEFSLAPHEAAADEEHSILGRPVDDTEETAERIDAVTRYVPYAQRAFKERGLTYPFRASAQGDALAVLPGLKRLALACAQLGSYVSVGGAVAKEFERRGLRALHALTSGWAACVGSPRASGSGPRAAVKKFRSLLARSELGTFERDSYPTSGDLGADGFLVAGRTWGGPVFYFQAKNSFFDFRDYPPEFARLPQVLEDWFGKKLNQTRRIVPVLGLNSVLTSQAKDQAYVNRGEGFGVHIFDVVDILAAEYGDPSSELRRSICLEL